MRWFNIFGTGASSFHCPFIARMCYSRLWTSDKRRLLKILFWFHLFNQLLIEFNRRNSKSILAAFLNPWACHVMTGSWCTHTHTHTHTHWNKTLLSPVRLEDRKTPRLPKVSRVGQKNASNGEGTVLEIWGVWSTPSLPSLTGALWPWGESTC